KLNEEKLKEMSFIDFLKYMKDYVGSLCHVNKPNEAYKNACNVVGIIKHRFVVENHWTWEEFDSSFQGKNLNLYSKKLKHYNSAKNEKSKKDFLEEVVKEYCYDLTEIIRRREYKPTDPAV